MTDPQENANGGAPRFQVNQPPPIVIRSSEDKARVWKLWKTQWQFFVGAAKLTTLPKVDQANILMNALGSDVIEIYANWELTQQQKDDPEQLIGKFDAEFGTESTENLVFNTYKFFSIDQGPSETFDEFLLKLRAASRLCKFNETIEGMTNEERLVRDKIVLGVYSDDVRKKLLDDEKLTLNKAISVCRSREKTKKELRMMGGESKTVDRVEVKRKQSAQKPTSSSTSSSACIYCGGRHPKGKPNCPAAEAACNYCARKGHYEKMCFRKLAEERSDGGGRERTSARQDKQSVAMVEARDWAAEDDDYRDEYDFRLCDIVKANDDVTDWVEKVKVEGQVIDFKLDTGAQCSIVSRQLTEQLGVQLSPSTTRCIVSYNGQRTDVLGEFRAACECHGREVEATFKVVAIDSRPILGKDDCVRFGLVKRVDVADDDIFRGLGSFKDYEYRLEFVEDPQFAIRPARTVPHKIRGQVKEELDMMERIGIIKRQREPTPVVSNMVVVRKNGKIRVCLDPTDINKNLRRRHFPLRSLEEIAARVSGSRFFTLLDLKKGFWQIKVDEDSQKFLTFSTPWGRYCYTCFPFGLCTGPELFQEKMTTLLDGEEGTEVSMDDILIHAPTLERLKQRETQVLKRIRDEGLKLNREKCVFQQKRVKFLGHELSEEGLLPDPQKLEAVRKLAEPKDKPQVQRLLGMVTYLAKFIPNLSSITEPLRQLLRKGIAFVWEEEHKTAFEEIKQTMTTMPLLKFYDVNAENTITVDSSSYAMGAVLMQEGRPVAYASKSLSPAQRNYPPLEKEALAVRFGCQKFHPYIFGRPVTIQTDHKPLQAIFSKPLDRAPARLKRIIFDVKPYAPEVVYVKGKDIPIADTLSRDVDNEPSTEQAGDKLEVDVILSISNKWAQDIIEETERDGSLTRLAQTIQKGWPDAPEGLTADVREFWNYRDELAVYNGMIMKGDRVLVPARLRPKVLEKLHVGHFGAQSAIKRAKNVVFWQKMVDDIKEYSERCSTCQQFARSQQKETMILKEIPRHPFQIVAVDIFEYQRKHYLTIIDSYSGWVDFVQLETMEARETVSHMKRWFGIHGVPEIVESDNGGQFDSAHFKEFASKWNFNWKPSSPHYHQANGLAERGVQIAKGILKKCLADGSDIDEALLNYRNTPREGNLFSPNQRLQSRVCRSPIHLDEQGLYPRVVEQVSEKLKVARMRQKRAYDKTAAEREPFNAGEPIRIQNPVTRQWNAAQVVASAGHPRSYLVRNENETILRRNSRFIRTSGTGKTAAAEPTTPSPAPDDSAQQAQQSPIQPLRTPIKPPSDPLASASNPGTPVEGHSEFSVTSQQPIRIMEGTPTRTSRYGRQIRPNLKPDYVYF